MRPEIKQHEKVSELETPERCWILEVANDAGDDAASIARARVPAGVTTEWHELQDIDERYVIIEGRGRVELGGLSPAEVGPGDVVRIPRGTAQRIANTATGDLVFYCVCTPRYRPEQYVRRTDLEGRPPITNRG